MLPQGRSVEAVMGAHAVTHFFLPKRMFESVRGFEALTFGSEAAYFPNLQAVNTTHQSSVWVGSKFKCHVSPHTATQGVHFYLDSQKGQICEK